MSLRENRELIKKAMIDRIGQSSFLLGKILIAELQSETGLDTMSVRDSLATLAREKWLSGVAINTGIPTGRVYIIGEIPKRPDALSLVRWRIVMSNAGLNETDITHLLPCHEKLHDMDEADMLLLANGLLSLRKNQSEYTGVPKFIVSANSLLGSSKILGNLPAKALRAFGINIDLFTDSPSYMVVAGYANPKAVLLIENPHAFEVAVESKVISKVTLIATFGYGLSRSDDSFGKQLAEIVESGKAMIPLVRKGNPPSLDELFAHENLFFWGDLDAEGVRIFERLKTQLPQLKQSGLNQVMQEFANQPDKSHPYVTIAGKDKQKNIVADGGLCRAVDQEIITAKHIEREFGLVTPNE